jgi:CrcB protein
MTPPTLYHYTLIFIAGGIGSACRYTFTLLAQRLHLHTATATFTANTLACFILGFISHTITTLPTTTATHLRLALITGFCGGFSTFSSFTHENITFTTTHTPHTALIYTITTFITTHIALLIGIYLSKLYHTTQ